MKKIEEVVLTPELFQEIISEMTEDTVELKRLQEESNSSITDQKEYLNQLRAQRKATINNIRMTKRSLRNEKRSLKKVNKSLSTKSNLFAELNNKFASKEETLVEVKRYIKER
ncbi:MAG: hypothetical protein IJY25_00165 [Bacilli bacterium]|nr:hypothetical protein [Bacilli bacterium]